MPKSPLFSTIAAFMVLLLVSACAEDSKDASVAKPEKAPVKKEETTKTASKAATRKVPQAVPVEPAKKDTAKTGSTKKTDWKSVPIMNQPVEFSSPENVAKTLQDIEEQAGSRAAQTLKSTMGFIKTYDLSVGRDEAKLYKKLNGKTPNQIIAMKKKR